MVESCFPGVMMRNTPGKSVACSVTMAKIWEKPAACLPSGISETVQGHQHSTCISSGRITVYLAWRGRHTCTVTSTHINAERMKGHIVNTNHTYSNQRLPTDTYSTAECVVHPQGHRHRSEPIIIHNVSFNRDCFASNYHYISKCCWCLWMSAITEQDNEQDWQLTWFLPCPEHSASQYYNTLAYIKKTLMHLKRAQGMS